MKREIIHILSMYGKTYCGLSTMGNTLFTIDGKLNNITDFRLCHKCNHNFKKHSKKSGG